MAWTFTVDTELRFTHWQDAQRAAEWFARFRQLTNAAALAAAEREGWPAQRTLVRSAFEALSNAYRAANIAPTADPIYRQWWADWYAGTLSNDDDPNQSAPHTFTRFGIIHRRMQELWHTVHGDDLGRAFVLARLDPTNGRAHFDCIDWTPPGPNDGPCRWDTETQPRGAPWTWNAWLQRGLGLFQRREMLGPWKLYADAAADFAQRIGTRTPQALARDAHTFATLQNIQTARARNIGPAELLALSERIPADIATARITDPRFRDWSNGIMTAGSALAAINPIAGAIVSGIGALIRLLPAAVGVDFDQFGRLSPAWEIAQIDGGPTEREPPTMTVPGIDTAPLTPQQRQQAAFFASFGMDEIAPQLQATTYQTQLASPAQIAASRPETETTFNTITDGTTTTTTPPRPPTQAATPWLIVGGIGLATAAVLFWPRRRSRR